MRRFYPWTKASYLVVLLVLLWVVFSGSRPRKVKEPQVRVAVLFSLPFMELGPLPNAVTWLNVCPYQQSQERSVDLWSASLSFLRNWGSEASYMWVLMSGAELLSFWRRDLSGWVSICSPLDRLRQPRFCFESFYKVLPLVGWHPTL